MKAAVYARVSTSDKGQDPQVQTAELTRFCAARGWSIHCEIIDHGYSGGTDKRPGLSELMSLARLRKIDIVVVTKLDRFARSLKHLVAALDEFKALGVQFVSVGDQIDLTTASGRLMLHLLAAFAEFERGLVRERTLLGLAHAKSKGVRLGRPKVRNDTAIIALREKGLSHSEIQRRLRCSKGAVYRALKGSPKTPVAIRLSDAEGGE